MRRLLSSVAVVLLSLVLGSMPAGASRQASCAELSAELQTELTRERTAQLLGASEDASGEELGDLAFRALNACYEEAFDACVRENQWVKGIEMIGIQRAAQLSGLGEDALDFNKIYRCLNF